MIRLKTKEEIKILREGGKKLASVLNMVAEKAVPGATTGELEALACALIQEAGGRPAFKNLPMGNDLVFPTALCTSINDEIVHAPALPARTLKSGDIVGIDIGMEYPIKYQDDRSPRNKYSRLGGYYTDMAVTLIVGAVDAEIKALVDTTKEALDLGIKKVKPGNTLNDIGKTIQIFVEARGFSVVRDLVGHGVGHKIHEDPPVPNYAFVDSGWRDTVLKPGMVIAIEPMINMGSWQIRQNDGGFAYLTVDGSLSAHFEHTIAVTEDGCEVLTAF